MYGEVGNSMDAPQWSDSYVLQETRDIDQDSYSIHKIYFIWPIKTLYDATVYVQCGWVSQSLNVYFWGLHAFVIAYTYSEKTLQGVTSH